jgi:hypothetical protein
MCGVQVKKPITDILSLYKLAKQLEALQKLCLIIVCNSHTNPSYLFVLNIPSCYQVKEGC